MKKILLSLALSAAALCSASAQTACSLDAGWDTDGKLVADGSRLGEHILIQPDGKVLVACNPFGDSYAYIKRFNADGSVDQSYGSGGSFTVQVAERRTDIDGMALHDGTLYICGSTTTDIGGTNTYVYAAAIQANGGWVQSFGTGGMRKFNTFGMDFYTAADIAVDVNGKVYMTGLEWLDNLFVVRMNQNGVLDNSWSIDGAAYIATNDANKWFEVNDLEIDKAGKVVITGKKYKANNGNPDPAFWNLLIARFNTNGNLDGSFATGGIGLYNSDLDNFDEGKVIQVTPANDYVVIGNAYDGVDYDYTALKVLGNGTADPGFGSMGWSVNDLQYSNEMEYCLNGRLMADGRILATGNQGSGDTVHFSLLMLTPTGQRDNSFAPNGLFMNIFDQNNNSSSKGMDMTPDGRVYLGGYTRTCANGTCGPLYMALSRYIGGTPLVGVDAPAGPGITFFPNPATSLQHIRYEGIAPEDVHAITLVDLSGKRIPVTPVADGFILPELASGVYLCRVETATQVITTRLRVQ